jgi:hypothetical protein
MVFDWGCEEEIVPAAIAGALRTVKALQRGRSSAPEYRIIEPVADEVVELTIPHIRSVVIRNEGQLLSTRFFLRILRTVAYTKSRVGR